MTDTNRLIARNVTPAILANACVFLFSVVDGIFVGQGAGIQALGAVNLALPFVLLVQALNALTCIGGVTITAIRFGRGDKAGAQSAFMHSLTLSLVAVTNVVITTINIFLDWLFVFPMQMGVAGAAIATGIAQVAGLLISLTHFVFRRGDLRIRRYRPQAKLYRKIVLRGLPEAIAQFSTPVTTFCMNQTLMATFGNVGINAFSIISYLSSFTMSVFFGASEGMQPLFGQAYGAKEDQRLKHFFRAGMWISVIGSALCVAIYVLFPHPLCALFGADPEIIDFTSAHMWEYCWGFVVGSMNTLISAYFYSTKRSAQAIALNLVRSLVMNSLIITLLPKLFGSAVVWHTFGIYEVLVLILAVALKKYSERRGVVYR